MTDYGFTAARDVRYPDEITAALKDIGGDEHTYVTGGARGGDAIIGEWLFDNYPGAKHLVLLATKKDETSWWWEGKHNDSIRVVKPNSLFSYRERNLAIVSRSEVLYAFPGYQEEHPQAQRSGSWQTIRMARRKKIPMHIYVQGENNWTENIS